jgi:choline kinase
MIRGILILFYKLSLIVVHFIISIILLLVSGNLSTVSLYRLYNNSWEFDIWTIFKNDNIKEKNLDYISDTAKKRIISDFLILHSDKIYEYDINNGNGTTNSLYKYLKNKV